MTLQRKYDPDAIQAALEKKRAANQRAIERKYERMRSPAYQQQQKEKQEADRTRKLQLVSSPEYQRQQREKADALRQLKLVATDTQKPKRTTRKKSGPGMLGRTPTADEKKFLDAVGKLPCIACLVNGIENHNATIHHTAGRTAPGAHKKSLPLCDCHHQHAAPTEVREKFPWLVPVHADGKVGGKAEFEKLNGSVEKLLQDVYRLLGLNYTKQ